MSCMGRSSETVLSLFSLFRPIKDQDIEVMWHCWWLMSSSRFTKDFAGGHLVSWASEIIFRVVFIFSIANLLAVPIFVLIAARLVPVAMIYFIW